MARVSRQSLSEVPSLDDNRAAILEMNPLAHASAKPDAVRSSRLRTSCAACDAQGGYVTLSIAKLWF